MLHDGRVIPSILVLSHEEQRERLRRDCPEAVARAVVAGDVVYDQLLASQALRPTYRRAFDVSRKQKLVVISSTWGGDSLLGAQPNLPRILGENLPVDEFRVVVALHPNVWFGHSRWQVAQWFAACRRAGVGVLDDLDEWRAAILAADLTVGDHGSVTFYSTALGNPVLLATAPVHTVDADSPIAALLSAAPRLDPAADLETQVRQAIATHDPDRYATTVAQTTSTPHRAAGLLRTVVYEALALPEPPAPAEVALVPVPTHAPARPNAHLVHVDATGERSATITRFPAERIRSGTDLPRGAHLVAEVVDARRRWLELADVVVGTTGPHTAEWITDTLARLPGCVLATAPQPDGCWLLGDRTGGLARVRADTRAARLFASVAYRALGAGDSIDALLGEWLLDTGAGQHRVTVDPAR